MSDAPAQAVTIGTIGKPHGVRGVVRAHPTGATLGLLGKDDMVAVALPSGTRTLQIASLSSQPRGVLVRFTDIESREDAQMLRGARIEVAPTELPGLADREYYVRDMVGCEVFVEGVMRGHVADVVGSAANDVLEVAPLDGGQALLVPFVRVAIVAVDLEGQRIEVRPDYVLAPKDASARED